MTPDAHTATHDPCRPGTIEEARAQGLNDDEFARIREILGREPNVTELAIFAVMWSEHCSYKNSILALKTLPRSGGRLLKDAGAENAGLVDIGDGWAVAFKIESHNHPSAVEPFQGAATGVGGIMRDVFTMGARPLACLDSLHFGDPSDPRTRFLLDGVVRGIGHYGNCFGVPTVAGEVRFDPAYGGNPLVNAMAVGVVRTDRTCTAKASGAGNPVFYVGSRTGRDGIHGATFASEELSGDDDAKRPSVQVGDPFAEKLLLEATLELAQTDALVAIQDMGAAGLTCSSSEMSAAGGVGMDIDLDKVPLRTVEITPLRSRGDAEELPPLRSRGGVRGGSAEDEMAPWEIMLSESQERMLLVAHRGKEDIVRRIFEKWDLQAVEVGVVTDDGLLRIRHKGRVVVEVPSWNLVLGGGAPQYQRESKRPARLDEYESFDLSHIPEPSDPGAALLDLLSDPEIASKRWIYEQYDQSVRTNTAVEAGFGDAAVIRVEGTTKGLAVKTDGNGRLVSLNPRVGAERLVAEAARNVACVGARPVAITNCLNFGHPYKPEVYYFFREAVAGMGAACREFGTPVTGGNVSFYNETLGSAVLPTPVMGMLGVLDDVSRHIKGYFQSAGDAVYLLGGLRESRLPSASEHLSPPRRGGELKGGHSHLPPLRSRGGVRGGLSASVYMRRTLGRLGGIVEPVDYNIERALIEVLVAGAQRGIIRSAHDVSDGGLAVCLAECCIMNQSRPVGAVVQSPPLPGGVTQHLSPPLRGGELKGGHSSLPLLHSRGNTSEFPPLRSRGGVRGGSSGVMQPEQTDTEFRPPEDLAALLFGETPGRVVVSIAEGDAAQLEALCGENELPFAHIGVVSGDRLIWEDVFDLALDDLVKKYYYSLLSIMEK